MTDLVDKLRLARQTPHVALHDYNLLRSKAAEVLVCVFEGHEDHPYYDTVFRRITENFKYQPLVVNGKDQVLGLRELLCKRDTPAEKNVAYFIDKDYDDYKQYLPSDNTYCTHGYSIENNLCTVSTLQPLLETEYFCYKTGDQHNIENITKIFHERLSEYSELMKETNKAIYFARKNSIRLQGINNQITRYLDINLSNITPSGTDHFSLIGWPETVDTAEIPASLPEFDNLSPLTDWRGKFALGVYTELLHRLKDDRCSNKPQLFSVKSGMKFNPKGDIIRTLAVLAPIPSCLRSFVSSLNSHQKSDPIPA
ncbi:DUF4435 domain-containing protein [Pseudomonas sp. IT-P291]|uniref:DUF4435 domain-containing protein n=1 Tax=Pseudomonas sp. IT-P291 TaxID=3026448 RepID=UPI0039E01930